MNAQKLHPKDLAMMAGALMVGFTLAVFALRTFANSPFDVLSKLAASPPSHTVTFAIVFALCTIVALVLIVLLFGRQSLLGRIFWLMTPTNQGEALRGDKWKFLAVVAALAIVMVTGIAAYAAMVIVPDSLIQVKSRRDALVTEYLEVIAFRDQRTGVLPKPLWPRATSLFDASTQHWNTYRTRLSDADRYHLILIRASLQNAIDQPTNAKDILAQGGSLPPPWDMEAAALGQMIEMNIAERDPHRSREPPPPPPLPARIANDVVQGDLLLDQGKPSEALRVLVPYIESHSTDADIGGSAGKWYVIALGLAANAYGRVDDYPNSLAMAQRGESCASQYLKRQDVTRSGRIGIQIVRYQCWAEMADAQRSLGTISTSIQSRRAACKAAIQLFFDDNQDSFRDILKEQFGKLIQTCKLRPDPSATKDAVAWQAEVDKQIQERDEASIIKAAQP
jgi:hypothetical protein